MTTPNWIDEALALCEKATPGPWDTDEDETGRVWRRLPTEYIASAKFDPPADGHGQASRRSECNPRTFDQRHNDAAFIAAAREGWPKALKALEILLAAVRQDCDHACEGHSRACNAADAIRRGEF